MEQRYQERLASLEDRHERLSRRVEAMDVELRQRIEATEQMLTDFRQDMSSGLAQINQSLIRVSSSALKSWPPEAVEVLKSAREEVKREASTKGIWMGAAISLLGLIGVLIIALSRHWS